jgi:hypothetical protein
MQRLAVLVVCVLAGCSTHPVADVLDFCKPGKLYSPDVNPYGGVCIQQGPVMPPVPAPVCVPNTVPLPPTVDAPVVPPPLPLPKAGG